MTTGVQSANVSYFYRFLALGMRYPEHCWLTSYYLDTLFTILSELVDVAEMKKIQTILSSQHPDQLLEDLQIEYTRLFINDSSHVVAPPFASIYIDCMFQSPFTEKTHNFYRQKQCTVSDRSLPPDYLVAELEFLSKLADEHDLQGEEEFLRLLFRPWFSQFRDRVSKVSCHCYYKVMIQLIDFFTKEDEENGI